MDSTAFSKRERINYGFALGPVAVRVCSAPAFRQTTPLADLRHFRTQLRRDAFGAALLRRGFHPPNDRPY